MMDVTRVQRLLQHEDPDNALLSVYFTVPAEAGALRQMWVRLERLLASVEPPPGRGAKVRNAISDECVAVREAVTEHVRDWLGHGVAVMRSAATGWGTELDVVWPVPDRAVVGPRPYIRPLLSALSRAGPYVVAVVNRRHAWMFRVDGHTIEPINRLVGAGVRDPSYAGWAGYQEYGVRQRAWELARRHYRTTASTLAAVSQQVCRDIVVGGHEATIGEFVAELPDWLRQRVTGTFVVDPHTMTLGELRVRSERARMDWRVDHERRLRTELAEWESGGSAVSGLAPSAQAVSRSQAELLVVAGEDVAPGYVCDQCGELRVEDDKCPGCGALLRAVSDLVDELMARIVTEHGQVEFVDTGDGAEPQVAARLRPGFARRASQG